MRDGGVKMLRLSEDDLAKLKKKHNVRDGELARKSEEFERTKTPKKSKYKNTATLVNNIRFHSAREAKRYTELLLLRKADKIKLLTLQVKYPFVVNGVKICSYIADFVYDKDGEIIVEDCKGFRTQSYVIKRKLMKALYDIDILET